MKAYNSTSLLHQQFHDMLLASCPVLKKQSIQSCQRLSNQVAGSAAQPIKEARGTLEDDFKSVATGVARQDAVRTRQQVLRNFLP